MIAVNTDIAAGLRCSECGYVFTIGDQYIVTRADPYTVRCHLRARDTRL